MKNLAKLRNEKKLTQKELADKTGISISAITMYEIGERKPSLKRAKILADFFWCNNRRNFFDDVAHTKRANPNPKSA